MKFQIQELRPEVLAFALMMEARLREKDADKGDGWKRKSLAALRTDLSVKHVQLNVALDVRKTEGIARALADMGNISMFLVDAHGALPVEKSQEDEFLVIPAFLRAHRDE
jgi:hypothetical protein